jgi:DNA-damage-inducible protein J
MLNCYIKKRFDIFCADAGMDAAVAVNLFARAVLRERRIPFEIVGSDDPFYSVKNQARLTEAMDQIEAGGGAMHELIEAVDVPSRRRQSLPSV